MVTVTDKAAEELNKILKQENKEEAGIKIYVAGVGCSGPSYGLTIAEEPAEGEREVNENGVKLFYNDQVALYITDSVFDYIENEYGSGFSITNPSEQDACGSSCGSGHSCH